VPDRRQPPIRPIHNRTRIVAVAERHRDIARLPTLEPVLHQVQLLALVSLLVPLASLRLQHLPFAELDRLFRLGALGLWAERATVQRLVRVDSGSAHFARAARLWHVAIVVVALLC